MRIFAVIPLIKTRLAAFVGGSLGQKNTAETVTIPKPADKICDAKYFCLMYYIAAKQAYGLVGYLKTRCCYAG